MATLLAAAAMDGNSKQPGGALVPLPNNDVLFPNNDVFKRE